MVVRTFGEEVWRLTVNELAFGLLSIGLGLCGNVFGWSGSFVAYLIVMLVLGGAVAYFSTTAMTLFQEQVEPEMQGRVFGVQGIVLALAMPIGMLAFGPMADVVSIETITIVAGMATILMTIAMGYRALRALAPDAASTSAPHT